MFWIQCSNTVLQKFLVAYRSINYLSKIKFLSSSDIHYFCSHDCAVIVSLLTVINGAVLDADNAY